MLLHGKVSGVGQDLIALHGLFGSLENLGRVSALLSHDFRVHALDLRNHGRSFHAAEMNYRLMAEDVLHYMDQQGLESTFLLGHSMGGKVAMTLAQRYPERVHALIVADIAPVAYPARHLTILQAMQSLALEQIESRQQAQAFFVEQGVEKELIPFLLKNLSQTEGRFQWRINLNVIVNEYQAIMSETTFHRPFVKPVLFLIGEHSDYVLPEHQESIQRMFPMAKAKIIGGTSHWLHAQKPETFALLCKKFLQAHRVQERKTSS